MDLIMENDYTYKLINEGFEVNDRRRIEFTDKGLCAQTHSLKKFG